MAKNLPAEVSAKLQLSESLAVGAIYDAEFNGFVHRCEPGFAICVPTGALMLISFRISWQSRMSATSRKQCVHKRHRK